MGRQVLFEFLLVNLLFFWRARDWAAGLRGAFAVVVIASFFLRAAASAARIVFENAIRSRDLLQGKPPCSDRDHTQHRSSF
jgi:hypothetical protein